jgi:phosphate starvation-inducible PhoH-like protein
VDGARRLRGFEGVGFIEFEAADVVRHPLVAQIVRAYDRDGRDRGSAPGEGQSDGPGEGTSGGASE